MKQCFKAPVLSISLGNTAVFKYGKDKKKLQKTTLPSGSIVLLKDHSRLYYHSISKIITKKKFPLKKKMLLSPLYINGRISITLRRFSK